MRNIKQIIPYYVLLVLAVIAIYSYYPSSHPLGGLKFNTQIEEIKKKSKLLVEELGLDVQNLDLSVDLNQNRGLMIQLQQQMGLGESNDLLRSRIPGYYFEARFKRDGDTRIVISGMDQQEASPEKGSGKIPVSDEIKITFDMNGNLLGLEYDIPDSVYTGLISSDQAKEKVLNFLKKYTAFEFFKEDSAQFRMLEKNNEISLSFESPSMIELDTGLDNGPAEQMDYQFVWASKLSPLENDIKIKANVTGTLINKLQIDWDIPAMYLESKSRMFQDIWVGITIVFFIVAVLILAVRRIRAYEISFKMALWLAIIVAVSSIVEIMSEVIDSVSMEMIIPLIFVPTFVGGAFLVLWAISESLGREVWGEKYHALDLIRAGHFRQSQIGLGLLRGISLGGMIFSMFLILSAVLNEHFSIAVVFSDNQSFQGFNAFLPALNELTRNFYHAAYLLTPYIFFVLPLLRKKIYSAPVLIGIGTLILTLTLNEKIEPIQFGFLVYGLISLVIVWTFYKFDILSAFFLLFTFITLDFGIAFFYVGDVALVTSGWFLIAGLILTLAYASWAIFSKDKTIDINALMPAFVEHITERERLQKELEIARNVQMDFLPSDLPRVWGLDLAAQCTPALEVGGDYYDFIEISDSKLGIVIGDVSGKGTQAAFYMTLTKGFIRALTRSGEQPAKVLMEANRLFYENARRNTFISMVYAIFDIEKQVVTLARAGHNPVIMHTSKKEAVKTVLSEGLALGLDNGDHFDKLIENREIPFENGDVFAFYTDGLTEARSKKGDEYGEERLMKHVQDLADSSAENILKQIFIDTRNFSRHAQQHDDMSLVVVKINLQPRAN